jgi:hypothetical protein
LKKSKAAKKKAKPTKAKSTASVKSVKPAVKMPVDTFDAWVAKQVKADRKGGVEVSEKVEVSTLPKDTFDIWINKQKPRENNQQKSNSSVPDTYDQWMNKQVAQKSAEEEKQEQSAEAPATS